MRHRETEVKIRVTDIPATRKQLRSLGFRPIHRRSLEDNLLLDTPDRTLRQVRSILRLRRYGSRWLLTYKGTPDPDQNYKSRVELETEIKKPGAIRSILEILGFRPVFRYQKYRVQYRQPGGSGGPRGEVSLDETPVGNYLELEGNRAWIDRVARQLGLSRSDYVTASYGALYLDDCRERGVSPGDMVFPERARRSPRRVRKPQNDRVCGNFLTTGRK
ncbi:MAG: class IV adenylate cyclase [Terriglobia bacterium]